MIMHNVFNSCCSSHFVDSLNITLDCGYRKSFILLVRCLSIFEQFQQSLVFTCYVHILFSHVIIICVQNYDKYLIIKIDNS